MKISSEQKPRIFISHRFDDKPIADVIRRALARWGFDDIYQAGAPGSGPRVGDSLTDELRAVLEDVDLVILVYTFTDEDWSWCMWECGLATHPRQADATRVVVFQCSRYDSPRQFAQQVNVEVDIEGIRNFTKQLHRDEDFFRGGPPFRPRLSDEDLDDLSKDFYEDLRPVIPTGQEGPSRTLPALPDLSPPLSEVDRRRGSWRRARSPGPRPRRARADRPLGVLHRRHVRRHVRRGQKGGARVGKTKRGKGTKVMAFSDGSSIPLSVHTESASPHEVTLVEPTLASAFLREQPERLIGDKAYDSDPLDESLLEKGVEMIAPHRKNRKKKKTQDGRKLRRSKRRWKIERLFA
jgi:hypothetical protein